MYSFLNKGRPMQACGCKPLLPHPGGTGIIRQTPLPGLPQQVVPGDFVGLAKLLVTVLKAVQIRCLQDHVQDGQQLTELAGQPAGAAVDLVQGGAVPVPDKARKQGGGFCCGAGGPFRC